MTHIAVPVVFVKIPDRVLVECALPGGYIILKELRGVFVIYGPGNVRVAMAMVDGGLVAFQVMNTAEGKEFESALSKKYPQESGSDDMGGLEGG